MKYQRKTVKKWQHQVIVGILILALISLFFYVIKAKASFADIYHFSKVVEKEYVEVPRLPENIEEDILLVFGEAGQEALQVARCESKMRADAVSHTNDVGVFQINGVHGIVRKWLTNPAINIRVAKQLYDEQGWTPWRSSYKCHKLK